MSALALKIRLGVSASLGLALVLGVWRILKGWPVAALALRDTGFWPSSRRRATPRSSPSRSTRERPRLGDQHPLMLALGIGLSSVLRGGTRWRTVSASWLASLAPMLLFLATAFMLVDGP
uniref:hypothetical protein n=1 Tax=Pantanalinema rosaneae TaxID=1620701 RepID=UPI003D6E3010